MNVSELITTYRQQKESDGYNEIKTLDDVKKLTDNTVMISSTIYEKREKKEVDRNENE